MNAEQIFYETLQKDAEELATNEAGEGDLPATAEEQAIERARDPHVDHTHNVLAQVREGREKLLAHYFDQFNPSAALEQKAIAQLLENGQKKKYETSAPQLDGEKVACETLMETTRRVLGQ